MRQVYVYLAGLMLILVTLQFFLAGVGIFGAGSFDAHESLGYILHVPPFLMIIAAATGKLERPLLISAIALFVLVAIQPALPSATDWVAALHPVVALIIWVGTAQALQRAQAPLAASTP